MRKTCCLFIFWNQLYRMWLSGDTSKQDKFDLHEFENILFHLIFPYPTHEFKFTLISIDYMLKSQSTRVFCPINGYITFESTRYRGLINYCEKDLDLEISKVDFIRCWLAYKFHVSATTYSDVEKM